MQTRFIFFVCIFSLIALLEVARPHRKLNLSRWLRWPSNIGLSSLNSFLIYLILPITAIKSAQIAQQNDFGLLNQFPSPLWLNLLIIVPLFDLIIYWQHRLFHSLPLFWRLHKMHHQDIDLDVTSGTRFHPLEILLSALIKIACVFIFGADLLSVLVFEVLLNATAMFNHGNFLLPKSLNTFLLKFLVTPEMHKVHHSTNWQELNTNFGFNLPWWDYIFKTYCYKSTKETTDMKLGLKEFREKKYSYLHWLLLLPFLSTKIKRSS